MRYGLILLKLTFIAIFILMLLFPQDFEAIGIDKRGFRLRLEKTAKLLQSLECKSRRQNVSFCAVYFIQWETAINLKLGRGARGQARIYIIK